MLAHESGGFAVRHCRLVVGSWGPVGCEVKIQHLTGVGVQMSGRFQRGGGAQTCLIQMN